MTKRCKFCGVKMADAIIDGKDVYQCPICGYVAEKPQAEPLRLSDEKRGGEG